MSLVSRRTGGASKLVMPAMILAVSMSFIDQTIVAIASPDLQQDLHLTSTQGQWVINAYIVALAAVFALGGRLADVWGRRRMVLIGVIGFAAASAMCGATPDTSSAEAWLIAARAAEGAFAALLMPAAIAIVYSSTTPQRRGRAMAMFFGITGAFTALGPIAGDFLLEWSWRAIFWVNLPVAAAAVVLTLLAKIPDQRVGQRIDWFGAVIVAAGMALSVVGFQQSAVWGWESVSTWACLIGGTALLVLFVLVELRTEVPLIKLRIFALRGFRVDSGVLFLAMVAFVPVAYFLSIYANVSLGLGTTGATSMLLYFFLGYLIAAQLGGRIFDAKGARPTMILGCALGAAGFLWWATEITKLDQHAQTYPLLLAGAGIGLLLGPSSADAVSRAEGASYGEVTGINQTVRNYGSALGFAVLGTILTHRFSSQFTSSLVGLGVDRSSAERIASQSAVGASDSSSGIPARMREAVDQAVAADFAHGMRAVVIAMAIALALGLIVALWHPGDRPALATSDEKKLEAT